LWERHAGGSLAGEQIADLDKRHFLPPVREALAVLSVAGLIVRSGQRLYGSECSKAFGRVAGPECDAD
jgi:hypothetical protein